MTTKKIKIVKKKPEETPEVMMTKESPDTAFSRRKKLAEEQGFVPIKDIGELTSFWPRNTNFEEFYQAAVGTRKHGESE